jgi:hypothetical protein
LGGGTAIAGTDLEDIKANTEIVAETSDSDKQENDTESDTDNTTETASETITTTSNIKKATSSNAERYDSDSDDSDDEDEEEDELDLSDLKSITKAINSLPSLEKAESYSDDQLDELAYTISAICEAIEELLPEERSELNFNILADLQALISGGEVYLDNDLDTDGDEETLEDDTEGNEELEIASEEELEVKQTVPKKATRRVAADSDGLPVAVTFYFSGDTLEDVFSTNASIASDKNEYLVSSEDEIDEDYLMQVLYGLFLDESSIDTDNYEFFVNEKAVKENEDGYTVTAYVTVKKYHTVYLHFLDSNQDSIINTQFRMLGDTDYKLSDFESAFMSACGDNNIDSGKYTLSAIKDFGNSINLSDAEGTRIYIYCDGTTAEVEKVNINFTFCALIGASSKSYTLSVPVGTKIDSTYMNKIYSEQNDGYTMNQVSTINEIDIISETIRNSAEGDSYITVTSDTSTIYVYYYGEIAPANTCSVSVLLVQSSLLVKELNFTVDKGSSITASDILSKYYEECGYDKTLTVNEVPESLNDIYEGGDVCVDVTVTKTEAISFTLSVNLDNTQYKDLIYTEVKIPYLSQDIIKDLLENDERLREDYSISQYAFDGLFVYDADNNRYDLSNTSSTVNITDGAVYEVNAFPDSVLNTKTSYINITIIDDSDGSDKNADYTYKSYAVRYNNQLTESNLRSIVSSRYGVYASNIKCDDLNKYGREFTDGQEVTVHYTSEKAYTTYLCYRNGEYVSMTSYGYPEGYVVTKADIEEFFNVDLSNYNVKVYSYTDSSTMGKDNTESSGTYLGDSATVVASDSQQYYKFVFEKITYHDVSVTYNIDGAEPVTLTTQVIDGDSLSEQDLIDLYYSEVNNYSTLTISDYKPVTVTSDGVTITVSCTATQKYASVITSVYMYSSDGSEYQESVADSVGKSLAVGTEITEDWLLSKARMFSTVYVRAGEVKVNGVEVTLPYIIKEDDTTISSNLYEEAKYDVDVKFIFDDGEAESSATISQQYKGTTITEDMIKSAYYDKYGIENILNITSIEGMPADNILTDNASITVHGSLTAKEKYDITINFWEYNIGDGAPLTTTVQLVEGAVLSADYLQKVYNQLDPDYNARFGMSYIISANNPEREVFVFENYTTGASDDTLDIAWCMKEKAEKHDITINYRNLDNGDEIIHTTTTSYKVGTTLTYTDTISELNAYLAENDRTVGLWSAFNLGYTYYPNYDAWVAESTTDTYTVGDSDATLTILCTTQEKKAFTKVSFAVDGAEAREYNEELPVATDITLEWLTEIAKQLYGDDYDLADHNYICQTIGSKIKDIESNDRAEITVFIQDYMTAYYMVDDEVYEEVRCKIGEAPEKPAVNPIKDGYKFTGWKQSETDTFTYIAQWEKAETQQPNTGSASGDNSSSDSSSSGSSSGGSSRDSDSGRGESTTGSSKSETVENAVTIVYRDGNRVSVKLSELPDVDSISYAWTKSESGEWQLSNNTVDPDATYYFTGWYYDTTDTHWYFLDGSTAALATGWNFINNKWYYLNPDDSRSTYIQDANGNWVYDASTSAVTKPYGSMYANEQTPDGYWVDADGAWVK